MKKHLISLTLITIFIFGQLFAQEKFTRADTLRGMLTQLRTCYDLTFYHIDIKVDPDKKEISGSNIIEFIAETDFNKMQIDLDQKMKIDRIVFHETELKFEREFGAVYIYFPEQITKNSRESIKVYFNGKPKEAKTPPWDGGIVWQEDPDGNPWVMATTQGEGASLWCPCKDHQSDEPDSVLISVTCPPGLTNVSNGRLRSTEELSDGWTKFNWFISYPINNYNITINIGKFAHITDVFEGENELTLDYYVLPQNIKKAKVHFAEVKDMLSCFEKYFGAYPFTRDGYKLVESSHWGMEHQSAVAYGNKYMKGQFGRSQSAEGLLFDFIIIHETAHEWWGNSITSRDIADMWIHEGFGVYAEALYVECRWGYDAAMRYLTGIAQNVRNDKPVIGPYNVNKTGSGDMYPKGALMLNTLRHVINNDDLWFAAIKGLAEEFKYQTVTTEEILSAMNDAFGKNYSYLFDQYLRYQHIPTLDIVLEIHHNSINARYKWTADVKDFKMPIQITTGKDKYEFIEPTKMWQSIETSLENPEAFKVATDKFFVDVNLSRNYFTK
ncbi:MAG: M1 family metallopeptidase [Melioribacteraceae bacterium]|nr:M1 family metallopeptidase [Melioribacteraceae bacterium]MCF8353851.1 M1 family metallopeptidase [Melioribacteraceae bacterium]MCF8393084.1 M1 family metallopeptidase [Melioribacteraceae bacterium]MCF8419203.1 M1 family metallopeptidase [Melioribacteraceae bacterium]